MSEVITKQAFIINNSPIEFIVVGPYHGRDTVLVKSSNAGLDLIGLINSKYDKIEVISNKSISSIVINSRQLNFVESVKSFDIEESVDERRSQYMFAWVGSANKNDKEIIHVKFNRYINALRQVIYNGETNEIELIISNIVLECSLVNQRRQKNKKMILYVLIIYVLLIMFSLLIFPLKNYLK